MCYQNEVIQPRYLFDKDKALVYRENTVSCGTRLCSDYENFYPDYYDNWPHLLPDLTHIALEKKEINLF